MPYRRTIVALALVGALAGRAGGGAAWAGTEGPAGDGERFPVGTLSAGSGAEGDVLVYEVGGGSPRAGRYTWAWGDGTTSVTTMPSTTHTFADEGTYTVRVTSDRGDGERGGGDRVETLSAVSRVTNTAPAFDPETTVIPDTGVEGGVVDATAMATDAGSADTLVYTWAWGDGEIATGGSAFHVYADDGTYTVIVTATDDDGASTTWTERINVSGVALVLGGYSDPGPLLAGTDVSFVADATDAGGDPLVYTWDFGDGTTGLGEAATHRWAEAGTFVVTLSVADEDGLWTRADYAVVVTEEALAAAEVCLEGETAEAEVGLTEVWTVGEPAPAQEGETTGA